MGVTLKAATVKTYVGALMLMLAALTAFGLSPTHASAGGSASKPVAGGSITLVGSPKTLDPGTTATQPSSAPWFSLVYGQLFRVSLTGAITPDLATSYRTSPDGKTVTMTLRRGVHFQDGTPFNAAAVAFSLNRDVHGDSSGHCPCAAFLNGIASITTKGTDTVQIHLTHRDNLLKDVLAESPATYIISPSAYKKEGAAKFGLSPVGAGPYRVTQFTPSTSATFSKWSGYYDKPRPYLDTIKLEAVVSDSSILAGCASGTLAVCSFATGGALATSPQQASKYSSLHEVDSPRVYWNFLHFNVDRPPFNNLLARQALAYATDPSQVVSLSAGKPKVTCYMMASGQQFWTGPKCPKGVPTYNPKKARQLVQQLGGLKFSVMSVSNTPVYTETLPVLQHEWEAVGMKVTLNIVPHGTEVANEASGNYNVMYGPGSCGHADDYLCAQPYIGSGSPQNAFGYKSAALDAQLARVQMAATPAQERSAWHQYLALDLKKEGDLGVYEGTSQNFVNNHLHNVVFSGVNTYYDQAWWSKSGT